MRTGPAIHLHHNTLIEYCYDYDERVEVIKRDKPQNEQEIRLRLFKMLSQEAIAELPERVVRACAKRDKAYAEQDKADAEWDKACAEQEKAYAEWKDKEAWHKKWCGCREWNGNEIDFSIK